MRFFLLILFLSIGPATFPNTIVVGKDRPVSSLISAMKMAKDNDTILLMPGIYKEGTIAITKAITLIGINYPVLDGESKYEILQVSGHDIAVTGICFKDSRFSSSNDYAAIHIIDATRIFVENNKIINAHFGIRTDNSTYCSIRNNYISGTIRSEQVAGNGIHCWKSSHALIENNHIQGHRDGIYFEFVTDSDIKNNISENNIRYGLHFMFSHNDNYLNNTFRNNGAGVAVMYTHNVRMEHNTFEKNWGSASYGILLKEISDSYIIDNRFTSNTVGIFLEGTNRVDVQKNLFKENGWAIKIQASCSDNMVHQNNFFSNTFDIATNGTLVLNKFYNNYWDKYEGYDVNKDGIGDVPYHPVSMYSMIVEQNPNSLILLRSFMVSLLDKAEKAIPSLTPENLFDDKPMMKPNQL